MKDEIIKIIKEISDTDEDIENIDLLENEILDSLAFIELISELEDRYDIEIYPTQVDSNVWRSVEKIAEMVEEKVRK
ncbi:MAG: hypothetical protein J6J60_07765 [Clostridia bacterium]|nr:hypothetical protein [Clostridia bacterium]